MGFTTLFLFHHTYASKYIILVGELRITLKVICSSVCHFTSENLKKKKKKKKKKKNDVMVVGDLPLMQYGGNLIRDNKITYAT